jgi:peptide/nickel transport system permease protein
VLRLVTTWVLRAVVLLLVVSAFTFVLVSLVPGDAARNILGQNGTHEQYVQLRAQLGLDDALPVQYGHWLSRAVQGDLGRSISSGESVTSIISSRLGVTFALVVTSLLVSCVIGVLFGVGAALRGGVVGRTIDVLALAGLALPSFWLGLVLIDLFSVRLGWLPSTGYTPLAQSPADWATGLVLPAVTMGLSGVAVIAKQTRDAMRTTLDREFVFALRARGLGEPAIVLRHALKNAAVPVTTVIGLMVAGLLSSTVLVEQVFALPGLGGLAVLATTEHDLPVIEALVLFFTAVVLVVNLLVDLAYRWLNPKVRT